MARRSYYQNANAARRRKVKKSRNFQTMENWADKTAEQRALEREADRILREGKKLH